VKTVDGENDQDDEVGNHHHQIESIGVVNAGEGFVGESVPVIGDGTLREDQSNGRETHGIS
jgi:hypothetical protein